MSNLVSLPGSDRGERQPLGLTGQCLPRCDPGEWFEVTVRLKTRELADAQKVDDWANERLLLISFADQDQRAIKLTSKAENFEKAFNVDLYIREHEMGSYRFHYGPIKVPTEIADVVEGVYGLDNRPCAKTHFRVKPKYPLLSVGSLVPVLSTGVVQTEVVVQPGTFTPPQVAAAYNFPQGVTGKGQTIAIIELGGGFRLSDAQKYFRSLGIAPPYMGDISIDGGRNQSGDADGEVQLDIEVIGSVAHGARIIVYFASNSDRGFLDAVSAAIHNTHQPSDCISISWGGPESNWTTAAMYSMSKLFQEAAAKGITVTVAAGDDGSTDGVTDGENHVDFPGSSPWVTCCGGTKLAVANGMTVDVVWNELANGEGATGGGYSTTFGTPSYQAGHLPANVTGRGVPDISGNADPATGYDVAIDGQSNVIGGTSACAPLVAALAALVNEATGKRVGFLNPILYSSQVSSTCIRDVTIGNNGSFSAGSGWDAASGLGVIDGGKLVDHLKSQG